MYINCLTCGQTEHESKFRKCERCGQFICLWCRNNYHDCHDIYSHNNKEDEQGGLRMRPYRGLTKDGKLVYGWHVKIEGKSFIVFADAKTLRRTISDFNTVFDDVITGFIEVIPETVNQFTGLKDKNGKEIYERDKNGQV